MRSFNFLSVISLLLLLGTVSSAWPYGMNMGYGEILRRDDSSTASSDQSTTDSASSASETGSTSDATSTGTNTAKETGSQTITSSATGKSTTTHSSHTTSTSIDPRLPPGGISMMTPSAGATTYYKIGDHVTFAWNYTSLLVTPTAVNVIASCSLNSATYTVTSNMTVQQTQEVVWDTSLEANTTQPLLTASYTLYVVDANSSLSAVAKSGYLSSQFGYYFGMYVPQSYTPLTDYVCVTCNSALSDMERQALKFAFGMGVITIASFTWFAGGAGIFST